jgi:hypothetical protein
MVAESQPASHKEEKAREARVLLRAEEGVRGPMRVEGAVSAYISSIGEERP